MTCSDPKLDFKVAVFFIINVNVWKMVQDTATVTIKH